MEAVATSILLLHAPKQSSVKACIVAIQVAEASQKEGLAAAQRDADLERMQCQAACEAAASAEAAGEKLRSKLQASQKEVQSLKERLSSLVAERKQQQCVQQLQVCLSRTHTHNPLQTWQKPDRPRWRPNAERASHGKLLVRHHV